MEFKKHLRNILNKKKTQTVGTVGNAIERKKNQMLTQMQAAKKDSKRKERKKKTKNRMVPFQFRTIISTTHLFKK